VVPSSGKVVVTGGAGFIGSHLVDRLLGDGYLQVVVLDNFHRGRLENLAAHELDPRLHVISGDIRNPVTVASALRGADIVFHLAAQSSLIGVVDDPDYSFETNVIGTHNVLRTAADKGVGHVIFASSSEVYGEPIDLPVAEDQPLLAVNSYGASKIVGEAYGRVFRRTYGLRCTVLRLASVYGPRDVARVIPFWLERAAAGHDLEVYGGQQLIDLVWIDQVVEALIRVAEIAGPLPPINIGSGTGTRIVDLARRIVRLTGGHSHIKIQQARPVEVTRFVASVNRMRQMLGIQPSVDPLAHLDRLVSGTAAGLRQALTASA